ncbi:hypothetical protein DFH11DRAFT_1614395 [Phellopilus nigrolimitatus]|nr:hypothetical protein DFH11DRAFT_1614395 [Phellopilus nigrolimitatus]
MSINIDPSLSLASRFFCESGSESSWLGKHGHDCTAGNPRRTYMYLREAVPDQPRETPFFNILLLHLILRAVANGPDPGIWTCSRKPLVESLIGFTRHVRFALKGPGDCFPIIRAPAFYHPLCEDLSICIEFGGSARARGGTMAENLHGLPMIGQAPNCVRGLSRGGIGEEDARSSFTGIGLNSACLVMSSRRWYDRSSPGRLFQSSTTIIRRQTHEEPHEGGKTTKGGAYVYEAPARSQVHYLRLRLRDWTWTWRIVLGSDAVYSAQSRGF